MTEEVVEVKVSGGGRESQSTPRSPFASHRFMNGTTPLASPMRKAIGYFGEVGRFTKLDDWLPITESRKGNAYYAAFHVLCSGIGFQALLLPCAFTTLRWTWGIVCLSMAFAWQLYTLWLLIQLHESDSGVRHSRYLRLAMAAFGEKMGKLLALFPIMYLSGGTCVTLIMMGGGTMKIFFHMVCGAPCRCPLTTIEWYLVFTCTAILLAQLPNLNSIAGVSLIGAITAVSYCALTWIVSVVKGRLDHVSYGSQREQSEVIMVFSAWNALGIIAFAFRGHNLVLEIQIPNGGTLDALHKYHEHDTTKLIIALTSLLVIINCISSFQIYAMPVFDNLEFRYTSKKNRPCPRWLRVAFRGFFGCLAFFIAVALPFLPYLAGLIGGVALPITLAYPCFMWIQIKRPQKFSTNWYLNWTLGVVGMILSVLVVIGAIWSIVAQGIRIHFFNPQ
ncbi:hypothetical protein Fmac_000196 [Flemingia macrophylla]|uniref:Amino acid transporter transmembrane domain-containing protein n=1 Tax=Flemingia macrophylla TaxID=520843 RepID=A0ABD1NDK9_9FABA